MDENKNEINKQQGYDEYVKNLKEELEQNGINTSAGKKKDAVGSTLLKVGIIILVVLGVPLLLFGACILLFSGLRI